MATHDIGVIGMAVMGQNLALNMASKGFSVAVFNRSSEKSDEAVARAKKEGNLPLSGYAEMKDFVASLKVPRRVIMLVKAGGPVDATIAQVTPLLSKGDLLIDGGNEWFKNTERRAAEAQPKGIRYMGMGVSGGEEGARYGPSLMPGGERSSYDDVAAILTKTAAQVDDGPCVSYVGPGGAGNYVKMVHNGIEYGDMQLIAEAYLVLKREGGMANNELQETFAKWNRGPLQSFLIEITATIFLRKDDVDPTRFLVDMVDDAAGSKGTGMWTMQESAGRGVPCPTMQAALDMRNLSGLAAVRKAAGGAFGTEQRGASAAEKAKLIEDVEHALFCAKICSYAQGLMLLQKVSKEEGWSLNIGEIARTWKGGCIIRAAFLDHIKSAYAKNPDLETLLVDPFFAEKIQAGEAAWRRVVTAAQRHGLPIPALAASLNYFDSCRAAGLPTNLVQAQRDLFGAHTFHRTDKEGVFHVDWTA